MPGYDLRPVGDVKPSLLCVECKLILKEAVQTCEGDCLCTDCFDAIARYVTTLRHSVVMGGGECGEKDKGIGNTHHVSA